jgi:C-terminal processing protease CtpA/Prc
MVDFLARYDMPELNEFFDNYMKSNEDAINSVESTYKINKEEYEWIKSNRLIFLLIDNGNASSSEDFIIDLKTIENVVTIGTNTGGFMEVSDNGVLCLPNSSIGVYLGVGLNMQREAPYFYDGVGIEPDIWIANDQILDKVLNMIELYKENR